MEIKLTDVNDPFFLWQCSVNEEEYFVLRREQNLLVDYAHFPYKLVELLQQCVAHSREDRPAFSAALQITPEDLAGGRQASATLTISESTSFRQITHLALRFMQMSEQGLRKHLAGVVKYYKEEIDTLKGGGNYVPGRIDLARQPSMPSMPLFNDGLHRPTGPDERVHCRWISLMR